MRDETYHIECVFADLGLDLKPEEWELVPHTIGHTILAQSNRATIVQDLEPEVCIDANAEGLIVKKDSKEAQEWVSSLERYPAADDSDLSERESEAEQEAWADYGRDDMRREMVRYLVKRADSAKQGDIGANASDYIDALTDGQIDAIYYQQVQDHLGGESCTWEEDYNGSNCAFHTDRAVWGRDARRNGKFDETSWDGLVPDVDAEGKVVYQTDEVVSWSPIVDITPTCPRCGKEVAAFKPDVWTHSIWHKDCSNAVCDVDYKPFAPFAPLAYAALKGDNDSLLVVQDAIGEYDLELFESLHGQKGGWTLHDAAKIQRQALKDIAEGKRPYPKERT
jgi:hypothetical protein